jgi:hypothetical protein
MATEAQIEANRLNSRKSTGPRSDAGKANASRNSTRFGIFSRQLLLPGEDIEAFERLRDGLYAQLQPVGELERLYVERIFSASWRLRRTLAAEGRILARWYSHHRDMRSVPDLMSEQRPAEDLERVQKHAASLERSMDKALEALKRIQESRPEAGPEGPEGPEEENPICENEANLPEGLQEGAARIEIVKTNPIPMQEGSESAQKNANCENEPNSGVKNAVEPGGGAFPAPTPDVT